MAERSQFWTTGTTGDGTTTITEAQTIEWFRDIMIPFSSSGPNTTQGVLLGVMNELAVSGAATPVAVATGAAVVEGYYYKNDAAVNVAISTPASATRVDVIVLRASHGTTRTVRITKIIGVEGGGVPAITQVAGTTWDIPLANVSITTGGVITLTDRRTFSYHATKVKTSMLDDLAVTTAKIADTAVTSAKMRDSAAVSVIGRAANSTGVPGDIAAGSDGLALVRQASALLFGQVPLAGIAADAIDDTKAGNRVPQFYRRQGGSATNWTLSGNTTYTPTMVRMQAGMKSVVNAATITFPQAFSDGAVVIACIFGVGNVSVRITNVTATTCDVEVFNTNTFALATSVVAWFAVGPE